MKKLLFFSFAMFLFTSCQKKYCWQCQLKSTYNYPTKSTSSTGTTSVCDKTEAEIRNLEKRAFSSQKKLEGNDSVTIVMELTCNK